MLLASDAEETNFTYALSKQDLQEALNGIHARSRSLLLDACYSEGVMRGKGIRFKHNRFHRIRNASKILPTKSVSDNNSQIVPDGLCGFTACTRQQPSGEREFGGAIHGVFTYYLVQHLNSQPADEPWDDLVTDVSARVAKDMDQQQTPVFAPNVYRRVRVFDHKDGSKSPPAPNERTLWDDIGTAS